MTRLTRWDFLRLKTEHELTETATRYDMHRPVSEVIEDAQAVTDLDDSTGDYGISGDAITKLTRSSTS